MSNYILFLDDERFPSSALLDQPRPVVVCRSFDEAVNVVREHGLPDHVCFDHDLGPDSKTGHDFAKWLVDWVMDEDTFDIPPAFNILSTLKTPLAQTTSKASSMVTISGALIA